MGYSFFLVRKVIKREAMKRQVLFIENEQTKNIIDNLKKEIPSHKKLYVFGNYVEIYYLLDTVPNTYFPLNYPWISSYFNSEKRIITELRNKKVDYIFMPIPQDYNYSNFNTLLKFMNENYREIKNGNSHQSYRLLRIKR